MPLSGRALSSAITMIAGSGFLLFGYDQGVMSGLLTSSAFTKQFSEIDTTDAGHGGASLQGTVVAIYEIGCFIGSLFCLFIGEKIGRKKCIWIGCAVLSVGAALQAGAYGIPQLIVGRIIAGIGNGLNTSTIPVWHSELLKAEKRGKGLSIELAINIFGVMTAYWGDYGMSFVDNQAQFRFPLALQIAFAVLTFVGLCFLPESPRCHTDVQEAVVHAELSEIKETVDTEREAARQISGNSYIALFKNGTQRLRDRTLLGIGGQFMQQLSGVNLITYYVTIVMEQSVGLSHDLSLLLSGCNGVAYFLSSLIPIWTLDRLGRRKLMMFAVAGQACCMAILAGTISDGSKAAGIVAVVMLFLFNFFFAVGLLAIPWLLPAEYARLATRTQVAALSSASNWIFTFLVVEITPVSIANIGWKTYIYFAVFNAVFVPIIYFFYPETRNLSLEQIDRLFTGSKIVMRIEDADEDEVTAIDVFETKTASGAAPTYVEHA